MKVAQKRDAVLQERFYFRKDICKGITTFFWISRVTVGHKATKGPLCSPPTGGNAVVDGCGKGQSSPELAAECTLMSIDTIINGKVGAQYRAPRR